MKPVLVMPTYNEAQGIEDVLGKALRAAPDLRVLVVDDASPDGTGEIVARAAAKDPRVHLLSRPAKSGLGSAYRDGFAHAIEQMAADAVLEMDADLSHDPSDLPRLLAEAPTADLVIGSRYMEGGRAEGWALRRRLLSKGANILSKLALGRKVRDCTSGFRCYRAEALSAAQYRTSRCSGYAFQIEMTARFLECGFRIKEVPITFRDRRLGASKMSKKIVAEALLLLARLASRRVLRLTGLISSERNGRG